MIPKSNVHSHTNFADGKNTPEEMVQAAIALGFHTLGFSEHGHAEIDDCSMRPEQEPLYRAEVGRLKAKYAGQIHILLGYEHEYFSPWNVSPYEYWIESVHYLRGGGALCCVDESRQKQQEAVRERFGGDWYAYCRAYFDTVCESIGRTGADILGHIELVMKFNEARDLFDDTDPRYLKYALTTAELAARSGKLIEVNTGAISRGYRRAPYPGEAMLRRIQACGGRVILTSDCHDARYLDCHFAEATELIKACGFRTAWEYRGGRPTEYAL